MVRLTACPVLVLGVLAVVGGCSKSSESDDSALSGKSPDAAADAQVPPSGSGTAGSGGAGGSPAAVGSGGAAGNPDAGPTGTGAGDAASESGPTPGKTPSCMTNDVVGGMTRAMKQYGECDVEDQAIDFDVAADYPAPRKPGYDPAMTRASITEYGTAFSGLAVQRCHPYCYAGNMTVGVDFTAGSDQSLRGEILFDFPPTLAPIAAAAGRNSLGWIWVDGPALPAGSTLTAQMVLKSKDKGILVANTSKAVALNAWMEFKYFPIQGGFTAADLVNITSIGFRLTLGPTAAAKDWHGVVYADHFQLRK
jgi:hypothetical protein